MGTAGGIGTAGGTGTAGGGGGTSLWGSILDWHGEIGSPFTLTAGPPADEVTTKLGWAEVAPTPDLVAFLSVSTSSGDDAASEPVTPLPGWAYPGLDYLVHEAEYLSTVRRAEVSAWSPGWFPLLRDRRGRLIVTDTAMQGMVWMFSESDPDQVFPLADSMGEFGARAVAALRTSGCGWSPRLGYSGVTGDDFVAGLRLSSETGRTGGPHITLDLAAEERVGADT